MGRRQSPNGDPKNRGGGAQNGVITPPDPPRGGVSPSSPPPPPPPPWLRPHARSQSARFPPRCPALPPTPPTPRRHLGAHNGAGPNPPPSFYLSEAAVGNNGGKGRGRAGPGRIGDRGAPMGGGRADEKPMRSRAAAPSLTAERCDRGGRERAGFCASLPATPFRCARSAARPPLGAVRGDRLIRPTARRGPRGSPRSPTAVPPSSKRPPRSLRRREAVFGPLGGGVSDQALCGAAPRRLPPSCRAEGVLRRRSGRAVSMATRARRSPLAVAVAMGRRTAWGGGALGVSTGGFWGQKWGRRWRG